MPANDRIDVHVHVVLDQYIAALTEAGGDPSGWVAPGWSIADALAQTKVVGVKKQILSITSPGPSIVGANQAGRDLTRLCNEEQAALCKEYPENFAFYASMPSSEDVEGAIAGIDFSLMKLGAARVVVMTRYGDNLLGHVDFQPVWKKLNDHKAIVFIHPGAVDIKPKHIAGTLPQSTMDYPVQTTRTAVDLVLTKIFSNNPDVKIILSHADGSISLKVIPQVSQKFGVTADELIRDFKRFYLDVVVSTSRAQLEGILAFASPEKILFGTDWPYAPFVFGVATTEQFDDFLENDPKGELLKGVNSANAKKLFGW